MKKMIFAVFVPLALLAGGILAQTSAIPEAEKAALIQTARDYGDGFYAGEPDRMERAVHPDLNKVYTQILPSTKAAVVGYSTFSQLIELTRAKVAVTNPVRTIRPEALMMNDDVACVKLTSPMFNDYLQMVKFDGRWKIVNVLWAPGPETPGLPPLTGFDPEKEKDAIRKAALDYIEGSMSGDVARVEAALHGEANRAIVQKNPQTGKILISRNRYSGLVEPVRAKMRVIPEDQRKVDVRVLDIMDGMAFVEAKTGFGDNYIQMSWLNGQWKILNILSKPAANMAPPAKK
jgi:hypothetical protein